MDLHTRFPTGGEAELEEVIALYGEKLARYAASILYNVHDAEDVVQDVFVYAYQNRSRFSGDNLSAWLHKITYHDCLDKLKAQKRRALLPLFNTKKDAYHMEDTLALSDMDAALKNLTPKERALLYGRVIGGFSYEELAQILGGTQSSLRKQYERAKKKAATSLEEARYDIKTAD